MELGDEGEELSKVAELMDGLRNIDEEVREEILWLDQNECGKETPNYAKQIRRRGRKSLS